MAFNQSSLPSSFILHSNNNQVVQSTSSISSVTDDNNMNTFTHNWSSPECRVVDGINGQNDKIESDMVDKFQGPSLETIKQVKGLIGVTRYASKEKYDKTLLRSCNDDYAHVTEECFNLRNDEHEMYNKVNEVVSAGKGCDKKRKMDTMIEVFGLHLKQDEFESDASTYAPRKDPITSANINFSRCCPSCKQVLCDGTTLAVFCYNRINFGDDDEYEKEEVFCKAYLFLKNFEIFQSTRYTNPDVLMRWDRVPTCVMDTFKELHCTGVSKFNEYRLQNIENETSEDDAVVD